MTIHDDALAAFRKVYDDELASAATHLQGTEAALSRALADIEGYKLQIEECGLEIESLKKRIAELESQPPAGTPYRPVKYPNVEEARKALGAPSDANYVVWKSEWTHLEQAFAAMGDNDILVLPERAQPYLIDSSKGFMASGVKEVSSSSGARTPVISNSRLWFAMSRARRGILGLGPGAIIAPSASEWTAPAQPMPMTAYFTNGSSQDMTGSANKLIEANHSNPFFANFELQGRDFGGVSYNGIALDGSNRTIKNIFFNGCWRGFSAVPNGESGALSFLKGTYAIENCEFISNGGPSPIMWNRTTGGAMSNVKIGSPNVGMITFWRSGGRNVFKDVQLQNSKIGINLEENLAGFELDWTGGSMLVDSQTAALHLNINPSGGSNRVSMKNVKVSGSYSGNSGKLIGHVYTTAGKQRKSDITWDGGQVAYLPASNWVS